MIKNGNYTVYNNNEYQILAKPCQAGCYLYSIISMTNPDEEGFEYVSNSNLYKKIVTPAEVGPVYVYKYKILYKGFEVVCIGQNKNTDTISISLNAFIPEEKEFAMANGFHQYDRCFFDKQVKESELEIIELGTELIENYFK